MSLVKSSMMISTTTYELTDAQENLRIAQEYINRDLLNSGDGLKSVTYIPVNKTFVQNYLALSPILLRQADGVTPDTTATVINLGILTTDNNVPDPTWVRLPSASPSPTPVKVKPLSDRQTILQIDPYDNIQYVPTAITLNTSGDVITLGSMTAAQMTSTFTTGEIYFLTSIQGGTFVAITNVDATNKKLTFATGDACGLNTPGTGGRISDIAFTSTGTALTTGLQRMKIIHYYTDDGGLLKRREFGIKGAPYRDNVIAEHVLGVQFVYSLGLDSSGNPVQPLSVLTTPEQQVNISSVQVTVTVETPHSIQPGRSQSTPTPSPTASPTGSPSPAATPIDHATLSSTMSTSLRNMQFKQALQPQASPTP